MFQSIGDLRMEKNYYRKIITSSLDLAYIRFTAEDMMNDAGGEFQEMKSFFILETILKESDFPAEAKREIEPIVSEHGRRIRDHIVEVFQKWLDRHTSPDNLLGIDEYSNDPEATVAYAFVERGTMSWKDPDRTPHRVDIQNYALSHIGKLPGYDSASLREIRSIVRSGEWELLDENTRYDIVKLCAPYIFREWKKIFGPYIKEPTKQVTLAIQRLNSVPPRELPGAISLAMSVQHVFGSMFQHLDIGASEFDQLHNLQQPEIDAVKRKLLDEL